MTSYRGQVLQQDETVAVDGYLNFLGPEPGAQAVLTVNGEISTGAGSGGGAGWVLNPTLALPIDPVGLSIGDFSVPLTAPLTTYAADAVILGYSGVVYTATDTSNDAYDCSVDIQIQNETGSQCLQLAGGVSIPPSDSGGTVTLESTDLSPTAVTGTDLSYNAENGHVTTTAGGSFSVLANVTGAWD